MPETPELTPNTDDDSCSCLRDAADPSELFRRVLACLPDVIAIADGDDRTLHVGETAREIAHFEVGAPMLGALADAGVSHTVLAHLLSSLERRGHATAEIRLLDRHGDVRSVSIEGTRTSLPSYLLVARDVTEQRALVDELSRARRLDSTGPLMVGAIHDFNNLLTPIASTAAALASTLGHGAPGHEAARGIQAMAESAVRLAREIMAFSRRGASVAEDIDVNTVLADMMGLLQLVVRDDIELDVDLDDRVGLVRADRGQLEAVVINLAANARDAMPNGGRLRIQTADLPGSDAAPPQVAVTLVDTGLGMDAETCHRALDPFFTTKATSGGTGLGLATAHRFATQAGGRIAVHSSAGEGTSVTLYLPRAPRDATPSA